MLPHFLLPWTPVAEEGAEAEEAVEEVEMRRN